MHLNLHLLRIFHAVVNAGGFSRAAEQLHISQPAVSKAVRELEGQLDLPLLERAGQGGRSLRGVPLTESGQALYEHARGIFALERAALEDVQARVDLRAGHLAVGASTTIAGYWLPPFLAHLRQSAPEVTVSVRVGNTEAMRQALVDCAVDLALVEGRVEDPRLRLDPWRQDPLRLIVPPDTAPLSGEKPAAPLPPVPWDAEALNARCWLMREPGSGTRAVAETMIERLGLSPRQRLEIGSNEGIARAVAAGLGVALLPARVVRELEMVGALRHTVPATGTVLVRPLFLLWLKDRPVSPLVRLFQEILTTYPPRAGSGI